jgi:energy-coupling factor transport system substrate-specific component
MADAIDNNRWRTVDIVVASVIAVAFGVVFWAWNLLWSATGTAFAFYPPLQSVLYGVWLMPAVLGGLIIRKPGAAVYCELVASTMSAVLGSQWGGLVILQGAVQGLGAEIVFAAFRYRVFTLPVAALAGLLAGAFAAVWDIFAYYATNNFATFQVPYVVITALSAAVIAGVGGWFLTTAVARTGVLDRFPIGRERAVV